MLRTIVVALVGLSLASCDNAPTPLGSAEAKSFGACLAKRGLKVETYLVLATAETSFMLCHDRIGTPGEVDGRNMRLYAALSEYILDDASGSTCAVARDKLMEPIRERTIRAFKKDGIDAYCEWVNQKLDQENAELWTRFWHATD